MRIPKDRPPSSRFPLSYHETTGSAAGFAAAADGYAGVAPRPADVFFAGFGAGVVAAASSPEERRTPESYHETTAAAAGVAADGYDGVADRPVSTCATRSRFRTRGAASAAGAAAGCAAAAGAASSTTAAAPGGGQRPAILW